MKNYFYILLCSFFAFISYEANDGEFLKNGITSKTIPETRYTKLFMSDKYMKSTPFPNRKAAWDWEFQQNQILKGPLNKNMH